MYIFSSTDVPVIMVHIAHNKILLWWFMKEEVVILGLGSLCEKHVNLQSCFTKHEDMCHTRISTLIHWFLMGYQPSNSNSIGRALRAILVYELIT